MPTVRLKVVCAERGERLHYSPPKVAKVSLRPVSGGSAENNAFYASTPDGQLEFNTVHLTVAAGFEVGKEYYVDISEVPPPAALIAAVVEESPAPVVVAIAEPAAAEAAPVEEPREEEIKIAA